MADGVEHPQDPAHRYVRIGVVAHDKGLAEMRRLWCRNRSSRVLL